VHTARLKFEFPEDKRDILFEALNPDVSSSERARTVLKKERALVVDITARDITAMRAALNTVLQSIAACEKTVDVVKTC